MAEFDGVWWSCEGEGPALVVPRLNVDWTTIDLAPLAERFRVVLVAPRGFGPSARPGSYRMRGFVDDTERVLDHLGIDSYAAFGYSMNGVMAARLALEGSRVTAVACGGFPLTADLSGMGERARARNEAARRDPVAWSEVLATYDPLAAEAFWDDVAALPRASLADVGCPVRAWWGEEDALMASFLSPAGLRADHDGMLRRLDLVLRAVADWLSAAVAQGPGHRRDHDGGSHEV